MSKTRTCNCLAQNGLPCLQNKCGPKYPWGRPKKNAEAIFKTINAMNRTALQRETPTVPCASGTPHSDAKRIFAAIKGKIQAACARVTSRTDKEILEAYEAAMAEKHALHELVEANAS